MKFKRLKKILLPFEIIKIRIWNEGISELREELKVDEAIKKYGNLKVNRIHASYSLGIYSISLIEKG